MEFQNELKEESELVFFVNGRKIIENNVDPMTTLLTYLRERLRLTGAKRGCNEGGCGSCTVMISKYDNHTGKIKHYSVTACLLPIGTLHGLAVTTVEGIGSTKTRLHPVQERIAKAHGSQCGFCTPGFVMSMYTLLRNNPQPSMEDIEQNLIGNLCRCTGYRPILEGFRTFSKEYSQEGPCTRKGCCKLTNKTEENTKESTLDQSAILYDPKMFTPYDPTQDIIFPPQLKIDAERYSKSSSLKGPQTLFFRATSLEELLAFKNAHEDALVLVGATKIGIDVNLQYKVYNKIVHPVQIPELIALRLNESSMEIGAASSISDIEFFVTENLKQFQEPKSRILISMLEMLKMVADRQIKNVASIGGSIMTGLPESDINTFLLASKAVLIFHSLGNQREISLDENFLQNEVKSIINSNEVLVTIRIPLTTENEYFYFYKQARRNAMDLAIVNAAFKLSLQFPSLKIDEISIAFGSIKHTTMIATKTIMSVKGQAWTDKTLDDATSQLIKELKDVLINSWTDTTEYKVGLAASFFFKFYLFVREEIHKKFPDLISPLKEEEREVVSPHEYISTQNTQVFQNVPEDQEKIDPVGRPIPHVSALKQTTGEATYVDDIPSFDNELQAAFVLSERAAAKILSIDASEALKMKGVHGFFCAKDIPKEQNLFGLEERDEEVFASETVGFVGQIIGMVLAETKQLAQQATKLVKVSYEQISQPILTIEEAIKAKSVWEPLMIEVGNLGEGFQNSKHVLEGETRTGFQEHFYMETNSHIAVPYDGTEIQLFGSCQAPTRVQMSVAQALNLEANRVCVKVKRVGGGFGGKETRILAVMIPIAFAAMTTGRPVRTCLSRRDDMIITGSRHPVLSRWKIGFGDDGKFNSLEINTYLNAGYFLDSSNFVRKIIVMHANNVYNVKNVTSRGQCCKTNLTPNTAFRGFGYPQALFIMENIVVKVAEFLKIDPNKVREVNMHPKSNSFTIFGQEIINNNIRECWEQILASSEYEERKIEVEHFNRKNTYKKRGISAMPLMFGAGFTVPFLYQAGALVMVYTDGSVLLSHGGVELGQGLHTKMLQIASRVLEIPIERIYTSETATDKVPNTSTTAASVSSDYNGMAVLEACTTIKTRLEPYKTKMADKSWNDWVEAAYMDRVPLSATGFYKVPNISDYDFEKQLAGTPYSYFTFGCGVSEVEIHCLTGHHTVLRTDIIMDLGKSINPAIDIGQIEGAFMQGYGLNTLEELVFSPSGKLLTTGSDSYKIPGVLNIPRQFNVTFLRDSENERAVYSSKAIGEPPLLTGVSVFLAIREAIKAARKEDRLAVQFDSPATSQKIRMACRDWITSKISSTENEN